MTRVLHVLPWVRSGGVERRRLSLAKHASRVIEQRVFCLSGSGEVRVGLESNGVSVFNSTDGLVGSWRTMVELVSMIRAYRPHIIHAAVFEGARLGTIAGLITRTPIVIVEETSEATTRSKKGHLLFRTLCAFSDAVVAISPQVEEMLVHTTGVSRAKIRVIDNGVEPLVPPSDDERAAAKDRWGIRPDALVLGTMSRLVDDSNKRVSDVIRALPALRERHPSLTLLVCGDGKQRPMLEKLAHELGVQACVVFAGNVEPAYQGFAAMDVFAHVATHEGFGLAVAEAAFCALPIVTTGVGGIASIVVPDETALIVPVGAPEAIAAAVGQLLDDPSHRARLGYAGRLRAMERFSAQRYVRDVEAMYRDLMTEHGLL